jgi:acyl carrier protein
MSIEKVIIPAVLLVPVGCVFAQNGHKEVKQKEVKQLSKAEILQKVCSMVSKQLSVPIKDITETSTFANNLGADSLDVVELLIAFEKEFSISIPDAELDKINTVGQVVNLINDIINGNNQDELNDQWLYIDKQGNEYATEEEALKAINNKEK